MELNILMKIAESNKEAAWSAYNKKFGKTPVRYDDGIYYAQTNNGYHLNSRNKTICIENYEYLTKFLHNFGHLIMEFTIEHNERSTFKWNDVFNLIVTHCTALKKLRLYNDIDDDSSELDECSSSRVQEMLQNPLEIIKVLPTLEKFDVEKVYFLPGMKLDVCFPNLISLDLLTICASETSMFEVNFPKLEHLGITLTGEEEYDENDDYNCQLNRINIENIMKLNPQLQSIWLDMELDITFLDFINKTLPNLQKVDLSIWPDAFDSYHGNDVVVFKNVKKASLGRLGKRNTPVIFENLKELHASPLTKQFTIDYIKKYRLLTSLSLICDYSDQQMIQLITALPDLKDLYLVVETKNWSANGIIRFLAECERLNSVQIMVNIIGSGKQRNWVSKIASNWIIKNECNNEFYVIEKNEKTD